MAIEIFPNEEISGGRKDVERKGIGSAIRRRKAIRGRILILRNESEVELFREMLTPT